MDGAVEGVGVGEGPMRQVMGLQVAPDRFDVVELRGVLWQPFDSEEEVVEVANGTRYGLAGTLFTRDEAKAMRIASNCCQSGIGQALPCLIASAKATSSSRWRPASRACR